MRGPERRQSTPTTRRLSPPSGSLRRRSPSGQGGDQSGTMAMPRPRLTRAAKPGQRRRGGAEPQFAGGQVVGGQRAQIAGLFDQPPCGRQHRQPRGGRPHRASGARYQRMPQFPLKRLQALRHCRRGEVQPPRRLCDGSAIGNFDEAFQEADVHMLYFLSSDTRRTEIL